MCRGCREHIHHHRLQRKPVVSDPGMHHGTCVTHVPWCMSGSLTRGGEENVPGIPGACTTRNFSYLVRGPWVLMYKGVSLVFQVQHPSVMDYWEGLHILTTVFFWLTICLNIMLLLLLISKISPMRAIDVSQFFHYLFFAPISILFGATSEVFAFMSMRPEEYKHTHSKVFFQYPFYRLILISLFLHGSPWTQIFWFLYVSGAYVANSWVPMQYIGVSNNHSYPRNEDDSSVFPISFGRKQGYEG